MAEDPIMDFNTLRAKFQDEELLLKPARIKPALPEKPKVVPPPQSPPHHLPAGARPSLLTSISLNLDGKTPLAPRVVFKDDKKESKKPLVQMNSKGKDKRDEKQKGSKEKAGKEIKEKPGDVSTIQRQKKNSSKEKKFPLVLPSAQKEDTELVPATPPPKVPSTKKKGFMGLKRSARSGSVEVPADPILDTLNPEISGPAPLISAPPEFANPELPSEILPRKALLPNISALPDSSVATETSPPSTIPDTPNITPPIELIPDIPAPEFPMTETPLEIETPILAVSRPSSPNDIIATPHTTAPTPPPNDTQQAISNAPSLMSPLAPVPSPDEPVTEPVLEPENPEPEENLPNDPPPVIEPPSNISTAPKAERLISALERAEDMSPSRKLSPADQRILNALEKARKKTSTSFLSNLTPSHYITSTPEEPEELLYPQSPVQSLPNLPPVDYEDRARHVSGINHSQASPEPEGITKKTSNVVPELLVAPPPPPKKIFPSPQSLGPPPEKPSRPPFANLPDFITPPSPLLQHDDIPVPAEFSETVTINPTEIDAMGSDVQSPELVSEWENDNLIGSDTTESQIHPDFYSNGITVPGDEVHGALASREKYNNDTPVGLSESPALMPQDAQATTPSRANNGPYQSTDNVNEDITTKKKGKTEGVKKRKGQPKNPYVETLQETNEDKMKTTRFTKGEKKAAMEGHEEKELKKREKQRLEKEKKELKERQEKEKKEQKEREKKEIEMKKKFKITGQEDALYQAKVNVTTKGRKNDLPVNSGDIISIIRTANCPKGKWLARDNSNNYGYVAVDHVEMDINEMLELGKKAAINRNNISNIPEADTANAEGRASNHHPVSNESFTDDSEEWTGDDDEALSSLTQRNALIPIGHNRTFSMPDMGNKLPSVIHQHSNSDLGTDGPHSQTKHEALQKLATFFHQPKVIETTASSTEPESCLGVQGEEVVHAPQAESVQEMDFDLPEMLILPPPDLYADSTM